MILPLSLQSLHLTILGEIRRVEYSKSTLEYSRVLLEYSRVLFLRPAAAVPELYACQKPPPKLYPNPLPPPCCLDMPSAALPKIPSSPPAGTQGAKNTVTGFRQAGTEHMGYGRPPTGCGCLQGHALRARDTSMSVPGGHREQPPIC